MSAAAEAHEGSVVNVRDARGYDIGHSSECTCGWKSGELRERDHQAQALGDHLAHLIDVHAPTKENA